MRKIAFFIAFTICAVALQAQNGKVASAYSNMQPEYNNLDKAKTAIDEASVHEKTKAKAKTWKVRGQVYQAIAKSTNPDFRALCENPLDVAYESYAKATELDVKKKYEKEINNQLVFLGMDFTNAAIEAYNSEDFKKAFVSFESAYKINVQTTPDQIDTVIIYNTAIAADKADMYDEAVKYYQKTIEYRYEGAKVFGLIGNIEKERGDTAAFIKALEDGMEYYPEDNSVLVFELINHYITTENVEPALANIKKGIENEPENATLYFAQGALYDKSGDYENAKASYEKSIEIDPDYYDAYYNLGALIFNKGAEMLKEANNIPPNKVKEYEAAVKASFAQLEKALPALEKAYEIKPDDKNTMITLKEIYFKLRNDSEDYMNKYKAMNDKIKELPVE